MIYVSFIADSYLRHPNTYLPSHAYNIPSEAEHENGIPRLRNRNYNNSNSADSENDVESYGFPSKRNRRKDINEADLGSIMLGEFTHKNLFKNEPLNVKVNQETVIVQILTTLE